MNKKIGFIGSGKMAEALIKAMTQDLVSSENIISSDKSDERLDYIKETGIKTTKDNKEVVDNSDIIFLAVKPQNFDEILEELKESLQDKLVISIAAGITLKSIESKIDSRVVRVMPNTPCLVGEMAAGFSMGKNTTDDDVEIVEQILNSAGKAFLLEEKYLDAVTGLSGSGPAFIALVIDALAKGAIKQGLNEDVAYELAEQTAKGTGKLLLEEGMTPEELIKMVASPKGTTEEGLNVLNNSDIKDILERTVEAATKRSKELGK